jgi:hypothetical protein
MYRPVALDEQARELLRARKYAQALHLADTCSGEGAPWAEAAFAEAAFLLMLGDPLQTAVHEQLCMSGF